MTVLHGDCLAVMPTLDAKSVDAIVCDPPYGLSFMGKAWDHGVPGEPFWREALRVAKPGAHLVAFGGTRTFHRLTCAIEDAGWEIRDCLSWLYGSGFPKSNNGPWGGTALKPAWEPIILARKPLVGTVAKNVAAHGTGALNVDGCRIEGTVQAAAGSFGFGAGRLDGYRLGDGRTYTISGRWPANVCLDEDGAKMLDQQTGILSVTGKRSAASRERWTDGVSPMVGANATNAKRTEYANDSGGASRFFYCAKASRKEREAGLEGMPEQMYARSNGAKAAAGRGEEYEAADNGLNRTTKTTNHHPTVKPIALMRWLCRLVTPKGGLILDPFCGSGSTGCAAVAEGFRFVGIEREAEYVTIAERRIRHWTPEQVDIGVA